MSDNQSIKCPHMTDLTPELYGSREAPVLLKELVRTPGIRNAFEILGVAMVELLSRLEPAREYSNLHSIVGDHMTAMYNDVAELFNKLSNLEVE